MNKTYTPELDPDVLDRLARLRRPLPRRLPATARPAWCGVYLHGLLHDGERKSIEPLSRRVPLPAGPRRQGPRPGPAAVRQPEPLGRAGRPGRRYRAAHGRDLRQPRGDLRHRRHQLPQAGQALRRRPAAVLRRPGQEGQLPGRRLGPLRQPRRATTRWPCGSTCPSAGWATRSGWTRPACPRTSAGR